MFVECKEGLRAEGLRGSKMDRNGEVMGSVAPGEELIEVRLTRELYCGRVETEMAQWKRNACSLCSKHFSRAYLCTERRRYARSRITHAGGPLNCRYTYSTSKHVSLLISKIRETGIMQW